MNNQDQRHIAKDPQSHFYPNGMAKRDKFFEYVLPWLVLIAIVAGILFLFNFVLQGILLLIVDAVGIILSR